MLNLCLEISKYYIWYKVNTIIMEEIINSVLLEYEKSTFVIELVRYKTDTQYVRIEQVIHTQKENTTNKLRINASILTDIITVLENYQKELWKLSNLQPQSYFSKERKDEMIKRYFKGISIPDLALQFDSTPQIIEQVILNQNIEVIENKLPKSNKSRRYFRKK